MRRGESPIRLQVKIIDTLPPTHTALKKGTELSTKNSGQCRAWTMDKIAHHYRAASDNKLKQITRCKANETFKNAYGDDVTITKLVYWSSFTYAALYPSREYVRRLINKSKDVTKVMDTVLGVSMVVFDRRRSTKNLRKYLPAGCYRIFSSKTTRYGRSFTQKEYTYVLPSNFWMVSPVAAYLFTSMFRSVLDLFFNKNNKFDILLQGVEGYDVEEIINTWDREKATDLLDFIFRNLGVGETEMKFPDECKRFLTKGFGTYHSKVENIPDVWNTKSIGQVHNIRK